LRNRLARWLIASVVIFSALIYLFAWSNVFTVKEIKISGAPTKIAKELVLETSQISLGQKLARIEPRSVDHRLSTLGWVKEIKIKRDWISGEVSLAVEPRIPKAYYKGKTLDATGAIFELPGFDGGDLPQVSAPTPELGIQAVELFRQLPSDFREAVTSLTAVNEASYLLAVDYKGRSLSVKWGSIDENSLKVQVFKELLKQPENKRIKRVDLSAPHAPIVK
jgi:cell division septal protein FtsQ